MSIKKNHPPTYFPELQGEERREADEWFEGYVRLVICIYREHKERTAQQSQDKVV